MESIKLPEALDTLKEIAEALGNNANLSGSLIDSIAFKAPLASPTFTGTVTAPTVAISDNSTKVATTAFVTSAIFAETNRATGVESGLRTDVDKNTSDISIEAARAISAESGLRTDVDKNTSDISIEDRKSVV